MDTLNALAGQTLGQYTIIEQIGEGGMATVFKAYQPSLNRYVALKILPPAVAKKGDFAERFTREAQAIGNLHHPHILAVYDSGQDKGYHYLAMRYIEKARTLTEVMKQRLDNGRIIALIGQIASALDHAHKAGIIHRDVKPSNVLMDGDWPLLSDFGLAKMVEDVVELTGTGVGMGTPAYMSPEQGMGKKVDHRTDIYALGIILFEMLTGQVPHKAETPIATVVKRLNEPLPLPRSLNPDIPEAVERVLLKALAVEPKLRFESAGEMATALKAAFGEKAGELLAEVDKTYITPAEGKTAVPFSEATPPSGIPAKSSGAAKLALPVNIFGFSAIALLIGLVLCGIGVLIAFQLWPDRSPVTWQYVLDLSTKMNEPFPGETISKWEAAQANLNEDLALAPEDINLGLRVFGQGAGEAGCQETTLLVEPNPNRAKQIQNELVTLSPAGDQSPLVEAIVQSVNDLELAPDKRNALIILTAGEDNCDAEGVEQISTLVQRLNVKIDTYIVGLGIQDPAIEQNLQALASASEGVFLPANTSNELEDVLELIQENLEAENEPQEIALAPTETPLPIATATATAPPPPATPTTAPTATPVEVAVAELTAQEAYETALVEALAWQGDAVLSEMQTTALDLLDAEGKSGSWTVSFYSATAGQISAYLFTNGVIQPAQPVPVPQAPNLVPFDETVSFDTKAVYETAVAAGGSALIAEGYQPSAALTQYPVDPSVATWYVNYMDPGTFEVAFTVIIDARSGEVIQALDLR